MVFSRFAVYVLANNKTRVVPYFESWIGRQAAIQDDNKYIFCIKVWYFRFLQDHFQF